MRDLRSSIPPWAHVAMAVVLIPAAAYAGGLLGWTVGAASLAILAVPTCLAALSGSRAAAAATALISATGCVLEAGFAFGHAKSDPDWGFAMLSIGVLVGLSGTIIGVVEPMQRELDHPGRQTTLSLRGLYDQTRENESESNPPPVKT